MSSSLPAKRRRLNESLSTLSKPFVSPLKASKSGSKASKQNDDGNNLQPKASVLAGTSEARGATEAYLATTPGRSNGAKGTSKIKSTALRNTPKSIDPAEAAAQKALTALELQIRNIRNEIDTLNQAAQINASTTDGRLEELTQKWKVAAQAAADEVFESVKDRVAQMGGVQAWRESEKNKYGWRHGLDEAEPDGKNGCRHYEFDPEGELLSDDKQEYRRAQRQKAKVETAEDCTTGQDDGFGEDSSIDDPDDDVSFVDCCSCLVSHVILDFHNGDDAALPQHRTRSYRLRQERSSMGHLTGESYWRPYESTYQEPRVRCLR